MRILFLIRRFAELTGAELYCYELGRSLVELGHQFAVISPTIGGEIAARARDAGVETIPQAAVNGSLNGDILHLNEPGPSAFGLARWPDVPAVATVHSQWPCERPIRDPRIKKYIAIRAEIADKIGREDGIEAARVVVIHNPIDLERFKPRPKQGQSHAILFVGTLDSLRKAAIRDVAAMARQRKMQFWLCGRNLHPTIDPRATFGATHYFPARWDTEGLIAEADETAGILLGRTTWESWACGRPAWIYDIDLEGRIKSRTLYPPRHDIDRAEIDRRFVARWIAEIYEEARR